MICMRLVLLVRVYEEFLKNGYYSHFAQTLTPAVLLVMGHTCRIISVFTEMILTYVNQLRNKERVLFSVKNKSKMASVV